MLETNSQEDFGFEEEAIEIFKYACFKEDSDADIFFSSNYDQHVEFLLDKNIKYPDGHIDFEYIANILKH